MKKFKIISYIILVIVLVVLSLTVYTSATQDNEENEKQKITSEIRYLDTKLVDLFNNMNNIKTRNYQIYTTKIEESKSAQNSGVGNNSTEEQGGSGNDSSTNSGSDSKSGSGSDSSSSQNSSGDSGQTANTSENYEMQQKGILTSNREIDWNSNKNELELIYTSMATVTLDLYGSKIAQEDILNFNKALDNLTVSIEEENKQAVLDNLVKLYEYLPKFAQNVIDDTLYKTVLETKLHIFRAYAKLDSEDWKEINTNILNAINVYSSLLTNGLIETNKQTSINKGYVMLNELKNAADIQNTSVFFIKYKNLLEEINNM